MEYIEFKTLLTAALQKNDQKSLTEEEIEKFFKFTEHLFWVNETTNLTAIRSIPDAIYKHYIDSLPASRYIPEGARVLDLGCGPGFPSVPLAICRPDLQITGLDSTAKKIQFVRDSAALLQLKNLNAISGRAEDPQIRKELGQFDVVLSRAVARLNILCELCIPYLKQNGILIAMKGSKADEELAEAQNAIKTLGATLQIVDSTPLITDAGEEARSLIILQKVSETPSKYPRPYAAILKKPL